MIASRNFEHIYWFPQGSLCEDRTLAEGWYYFDEAGLLGDGPFKTEKDCQKQLVIYGYVMQFYHSYEIIEGIIGELKSYRHK